MIHMASFGPTSMYKFSFQPMMLIVTFSVSFTMKFLSFWLCCLLPKPFVIRNASQRNIEKANKQGFFVVWEDLVWWNFRRSRRSPFHICSSHSSYLTKRSLLFCLRRLIAMRAVPNSLDNILCTGKSTFQCFRIFNMNNLYTWQMEKPPLIKQGSQEQVNV